MKTDARFQRVANGFLQLREPRGRRDGIRAKETVIGGCGVMEMPEVAVLNEAAGVVQPSERFGEVNLFGGPFEVLRQLAHVGCHALHVDEFFRDHPGQFTGSIPKSVRECLHPVADDLELIGVHGSVASS